MRKLIFSACVLALVSAASNLEAAEWGDLSGTFVLSGSEPKPETITPTKDTEFCGKHKIVDEWLVVGQTKGIKNVVVYLYLKEGEKTPPIHADYDKTAKAEVVLDNEKCRFEPRVALLRTTQTLVVGNKDTVAHNSKIDPLNNNGENPLIPAMGSVKLKFPKPESMPSNVTCSIHPWMAAKVLIRDNPYFAVTDENGKFTIKNVPAGKWTFQFWHESAGYLAKELKQGGKPLTWTKGRTELNITPKGLDLGKIEVGVAAFKKR